MKILLIDNDQNVISLFDSLKYTGLFNVLFCDNTEDALKVYDKEEIYIVIIDMSMNGSNQILEYIANKNINQRIITMDDEIVCKEPKGCEYCKDSYNKKRVLKPLDIHQIAELLKNFDSTLCRFYNQFDSADGFINIMDDIVRRFIGTTYDKDQQMIITKSEHTTVKVASLLLNLGIKFEIKNENYTKIFI